MEIFDKSEIKAALRQSFGTVVYTYNEFTEGEFLEPIAPGKWSPGDILGHLILSTKAVNKGLAMPKEVLKSNFGQIERDEFSFTASRDFYLKALSKGVKATPSVVYRGVKEKGKEVMIYKFRGELIQMLELMEQWTEKELSNYVLPHPAMGNLTLREMLFFTHFHTLHHYNQLVSAPVTG